MDFYVARQPIFDRNQSVFGYELLYRSGSGNAFNGIDGDQASSEVITNSFLLIGLDTLTRGHKAFINFTRNLLEKEVATLLPKESIVVEILEDVEPDDKLLASCMKLKQMGYQIALDDFVYSPRFKPLLQIADIVKVDFLNTTGKDRYRVIEQVDEPHIKFLAEKVETREDFDLAMEMGYSYFQGYFFEKPVIVKGKDIPTLKHIYIQLMQEVNKKDIDIQQIESLIKTDVSLSYKLLKFINSASFGLRNEIHSIKQAITLLGPREIVKWLLLVAMKDIAGDKPDELIITAITRAQFCESISSPLKMKSQSSDLFLMGLLSLMHVFLEQPIEEILNELPISNDIKGALLGEENNFRGIYDLILSYEKGDWEEFTQETDKLNLTTQDIIDSYVKSLEFANTVTK